MWYLFGFEDGYLMNASCLYELDIWINCSTRLCEYKIDDSEAGKKWNWHACFIRWMKQPWQRWKRDWSSLRMAHRQWVHLVWLNYRTLNKLYWRWSNQYLNRYLSVMMTRCHANLSVHHCYTVTCFHRFLSFLLVTAKETLRGIVEEVLVKLMDHHASIVVCV